MQKLEAIQKKVLISLLVMFSMVGTLFALPLGDVNNDNVINIVDALQVAQYSVGLTVPGFDTVDADVNQDGRINIVDALAIAQFYVGTGTIPPGGNTPGPIVTPEVTPPTGPVPTLEPHQNNPFAGSIKWYINEDWTEAAATDGGSALANVSTGVWMDRIGAINNPDGTSLEEHLDRALVQKANLFQVVIYDLPGRDCAADASNGELPNTPEGMTRYKTEYIDPIVAILGKPKYQGIRMVCIIEPDSLPNLVTNPDLAACADVKRTGAYEIGVQYALDKLKTLQNVYTYVDIAHSGWLGWDSNLEPAVTLIANCIKGTSKGVNSVDGFISNTANYTPTEEIYLPDPRKQINYTEIRSAKFYEWNLHFEEMSYITEMHQSFVNKGFPSSIGMLIDTSRNGWGGAGRPSRVSSSTTVDTYIDESRIDRRLHRGGWCNQIGAGMGVRPVASPASLIDAYVWIKPPGESDGVSEPGIVDPTDTAKQFDKNCGPNEKSTYNPNYGTNAMKAPHAGRWNSLQFKELLQNAYPPLN